MVGIALLIVTSLPSLAKSKDQTANLLNAHSIDSVMVKVSTDRQQKIQQLD